MGLIIKRWKNKNTRVNETNKFKLNVSILIRKGIYSFQQILYYGNETDIFFRIICTIQKFREYFYVGYNKRLNGRRSAFYEILFYDVFKYYI